MRNAAERMAINSVVQGSAADLIKIAMLNVYRRLKARRTARAGCCSRSTTSSSSRRPSDAAESEAAMVREEMTARGESSASRCR